MIAAMDSTMLLVFVLGGCTLIQFGAVFLASRACYKIGIRVGKELEQISFKARAVDGSIEDWATAVKEEEHGKALRRKLENS